MPACPKDTPAIARTSGICTINQSPCTRGCLKRHKFNKEIII